jgi:glucose-6-phosphate isomerase
MPDYQLPFTRAIDSRDGTISDVSAILTRRLADLRGLFADREAEAELLAENPILYEVHETTQNPVAVGQLGYSTTVLRPGKVGDEYFMTKGHFHALRDRTELYYGLRGEGYVLLQTPDGDFSAQRLTPGAMVYLPPHWGHRTVNTGATDLVFLSAYPTDAGQDYATIAESGFASIVVERDGRPVIVPNPRFRERPSR